LSRSVSKTPVRLRVGDIGEVQGHLNRLKAPLTVEALTRRLPIRSRAMSGEGCVFVLVGLRRGVEKPVNQVEAGDMAYMPMRDALNFYYEDAATPSPVNLVGRLEGKLEMLKGLPRGTRISLERR